MLEYTNYGRSQRYQKPYKKEMCTLREKGNKAYGARGGTGLCRRIISLDFE